MEGPVSVNRNSNKKKNKKKIKKKLQKFLIQSDFVFINVVDVIIAICLLMEHSFCCCFAVDVLLKFTDC